MPEKITVDEFLRRIENMGEKCDTCESYDKKTKKCKNFKSKDYGVNVNSQFSCELWWEG